MECFGTYETVREVASQGGVRVFAARKRGSEAEPEYVIKLCSAPPAEGGSSLGPGAETEFLRRRSVVADPLRFVAAVERQRAASGAGSTHVALVFMLVKDDARGPWYATRLYPLSLKKVLDSRIELSAELVHRLVSGIVRGLGDLHDATGLSHGNLKPSNILIGGHGRQLGAQVVLQDPVAGGDETTVNDCWLADLRALGAIIHAIVFKPANTGKVDWPLVPTAEWSAQFGRKANDWREFCGRLLAPHLDPRDYDLSQLESDLNSLKPSGVLSTGSNLGRLARVAGVSLVVAGGLLGYKMFKSSEPHPDPPAPAREDVPSRSAPVQPEEPSVGEAVPPEPQRVEVTLHSWPTGATVYAGAQELGRTPTPPTRLPIGKHELRSVYQLRGVEYWETNTVAIEESSAKVDVARFPFGLLRVTSDPPAADLRIGGVKLGTTPFGVEREELFAAGTQNLEVSAFNYDTRTVSVIVEPGRTHATNVTLQRFRGWVKVTSSPGPATVYWVKGPGEREEIGNTSERLGLPAGRQELVLRYKDFPEERHLRVDVLPNQEILESVEFPIALLSVSSQPPGAELFLDEVSLGTEAVVDHEVGAGRVWLRAQLEGYTFEPKEVPLVPGVNPLLVLKLEPTGPTLRAAVDWRGPLKTSEQAVPPTVEPAQPLGEPPGTESMVPRGVPVAGQVVTNSIGMELVWVEGVLGIDRSRGCWVGRFEVTQEEYEKVTGTNPSHHVGDARRPVERVQRQDALGFCSGLMGAEKEVIWLEQNGWSGWEYRLPTRQEWYRFLDRTMHDRAVFGRPRPERVGSAGQPDRFGLYDVLGNVWELTDEGKTVRILGGGFRSKPGPGELIEGPAPTGPSDLVGFRVLLAPKGAE